MARVKVAWRDGRFDGTQLPSVMWICSACYGLFVDISGSLYCTQYDRHQIVRTSLTGATGALTIVAGNWKPGKLDEHAR